MSNMVIKKKKKKELLLNCVEGGLKWGSYILIVSGCELDTPTLMGSKLAKKNTHPTCSLFNIIVYNTIHTYIHTYIQKKTSMQQKLVLMFGDGG